MLNTIAWVIYNQKVGVLPTFFLCNLIYQYQLNKEEFIYMARKPKTVGETGEDLLSTAIPEETVVVEDSLVNPLLREQTEQAAQMRDALLRCRTSDITTAKGALQSIAVLQIYHQVARIIRFIEVMDRLEDKLYASIDANLSQMDEFDPATMLMLTKVQGDLQKSMVLSQEMLKPYMDIDLAAIAPPRDATEDLSFGATILPKESRNAIRNGAQAFLTELRRTGNFPVDGDSDVNNRADTQ